MRISSIVLLILVFGVIHVKAQQKHPLTVGELFNLVESNSKTLQREKTSVEFANKGIETARSQRLPEINTSMSVSYNGNVLIADRDFSNMQGYSSPHLGNSFALEARQVVYAGGAIEAGIRMAELQKRQALVSEQLTREQQRFLSLGQYLDLYKLDNRMNVLEQNIELTSRLIDNIKAKFAEGMALKNDVTRYELQMETLRLELRKVHDQRAVLNYQLCNTLGIRQGTEIVPDIDVSVSLPSMILPSATAESSLSEAQSNSPMLQQAQINCQIAEQSVTLAKSDMLPKVALIAADQLNGPYTYDIPPKDINVNFWYVGVGIKYPVSSLFKQNKKLQQARIAMRHTEEARLVAQESLSNEVHQAWTMYQQSFAELKTQQKSVELACQNYKVVSDRYMSQLALITDMLDASNIKLNAELKEVDARINIIYNYYKMKFICGTL